jgi:polar amino acid transport system substrate-binding protein
MDGELGRFSEVENNFQGIVRVPEPVMRMQYRAAFIDTKFGASAASLESLARSGLRVGVVKGTFILEAKLGKAITGRTSSHESLAEMLINKHIDVAIGPYGVFEPYLKASPASKVEYSQVLDTQPMYHYLNKRHADLVPVLTETLRNMKRDGTLRNIWSKHK